MTKALAGYWNSTKFRSRTEAQWACYFDSMGIEWVYEAERFKLPSGSYLPDFKLPGLLAWAEVKGPGFTDSEQKKCEELCEHTGWRVLMLPGRPEIATYEMLVSPGVYGPEEAGVTSMKVGLWGKWLKDGEPNYDPYVIGDEEAEDAIRSIGRANFDHAMPLGWEGIEPVV